MLFTEGQQVFYIQRFPVKAHRRVWKCQSGIVVADPGKDKDRVKIQKSNTKYVVGIRRRCVFDTQEKAEAKCEKWNNWAKNHPKKRSLQNE